MNKGTFSEAQFIFDSTNYLMYRKSGQKAADPKEEPVMGNRTIGFIGCGSMAGAIIGGILRNQIASPKLQEKSEPENLSPGSHTTSHLF